MEVLLVEKIRADTREAVADIVLGRPGENSFDGDNPLIRVVQNIVPSDMMSYRSMRIVKSAAIIAVLSKTVIGRIAVEVPQSDRLVKPIAIYLRCSVYHLVLVKLAEYLFLPGKECLSMAEGKDVPRRPGAHREIKDETSSTVASSDTDEIRGYRPVRLTRKVKQ